MGECEEVVAQIAGGAWDGLLGLARWQGDQIAVHGGPQATLFVEQGPLTWPDEWIARHHHHHHRFDSAPIGTGCRDRGVARLPLQLHLLRQGELPRPLPPSRCRGRGCRGRAAAAQGVEYVYFIDEIFLPNRPLLEGLVGRGLKVGVQTRIDLWKPEMLELLGRAGCVSIEAGVESLTQEGRDQLAKNCKLTTEELADRLVEARRHVPFVQANLLEMPQDDTALVDRWRGRLRDAGVWANDPVPLFPYPGSPDYRRLWGLPDDDAWERAVDHYLATFADMSELQDARPRPLRELESLAA